MSTVVLVGLMPGLTHAACAPVNGGQVCTDTGPNGSNGGNGGNSGGAGGPATDGAATSLLGDVTASTTLAATPGLFVRSTGGVGGHGGNGALFGGLGGLGGRGGDLDLNVAGTVSTTGDFSTGLHLRSAGGQGGDTGIGGFQGQTFSAGAGGDGGGVTLTSAATIQTTGQAASGIFAESVGGGTGAANGFAGGLGPTAGRGGAVTISNLGDITTGGNGSRGVHAMSIGGSGRSGVGISQGGGQGREAGAVLIGNSGIITTTGAVAYGLDAASLGGAGGNGLPASSILSANGGDGGHGGAGDSAGVVHSGDITTGGESAVGGFAWSRGGNGGHGGQADAIFGEGSGGDGGNGGNGAQASAIVSGGITTTGRGASGLWITSEGGAGGNGAKGSGAAATGGVGGNGGAGGEAHVILQATGSISTAGLDAISIRAESLGGPGGVGGDVSAIWGDAAGGGRGGSGGTVTVDVGGEIATTGDFAYGVLALSRGGAGGSAGTGVGLVGLGGDGGGGSHGGAVIVTNSGLIGTAGLAAHAVFAQSIGGGGGAAGSGDGLVAIGGGGSSAGAALCTADPTRAFCNDGGVVAVENGGQIVTTGDLARGLYAQSLGGGGGDGGGSSGWVSVGGRGGEGGHGGEVTVTNTTSGVIHTEGEKAEAIFAQSVGGGGGNVADSTAPAIITGVAIGGAGGAGGDGANVTVVNDGAISTLGYRSRAIQAQSIGGGGGNGGDAIASGLGVMTVTVGGLGGLGGDGGTVTVLNRGSILVGSDNSDGIFAQSVGRGGGSGGSGYSIGVAPLLSIGIAVGGAGGGGGEGGDVFVENAGSILTYGDDSRAIFAQSVGGGGGRGGSSSAFAASAGPKISVSIAVAVGGQGGQGGGGDLVEVINSGQISTFGDAGHGIQAQSVGGGGGVGGDASSMAIASTVTGTSIAASVSVGGAGGAAGNGGAVEVTNSGAISTEGERAYGVFAQSVGGGGGEGGVGTTSAAQINARAGKIVKTAAKVFKTGAKFKKGLSLQIGVAVGGAGGAAGTGGTTTVTNAGAIVTTGYTSYGIFAQSVGGGGGVGAVGSADAQSVPFAAGLGASVGVGGAGGASGNGGEVEVFNTGSILTRGDNAYAILAQSIGGGGGVTDTGAGIGTSGGQGGEGTSGGGVLGMTISVGGDGSASGNGGDVNVETSGAITTFGRTAFGVFAQSVGGGGGIAGDAVNNMFGKLGIGGKGGAAGDGGDVTVTIDGAITTSGDGAHGVFAQSVGGGGGLGGDTTSKPLDLVVTTANVYSSGWYNITGNGGGGGDGGQVDVVGTGNIHTTGQAAFGVFAQSVGGGGGVVGGSEKSGTFFQFLVFAGSNGDRGYAGKVNVDYTGNILATGLHSNAIFAQSISGSLPGSTGGIGVGGALAAPGRDISVSIAGGVYRGGGGEGAGIWIDNGANNTITIAADATLGAVSGLAIRGTRQEAALNQVITTVNNFGDVIGDVRLQGVTDQNAFNNNAGAAFQTLGIIDLSGGLLTNRGYVQIGGLGETRTTALTGGFTQTSTGETAVDVRFGGASDRMTVTGAVSLAGKITPNLLYLSNSAPVTLFATGGGVTFSNLAIPDTLAIDYGFQVSGLNGQLTLTPRFGDPVDRPNLKAMGEHIGDLLAAGGAVELGETLAWLGGLTDQATYETAFESMSAEPYLAPLQTVVFDGEGMADAVLSCRMTGVDYAAVAEDSCAWLRADVATLDRSDTASQVGYEDRVYRVIGGYQRQVSPDWRVGAAVAWTQHDQTIDQSGASAEGELFQIAGVVKRQTGPLLLAGSVSWGKGEFETRRLLVAPVPTEVTGQVDLSVLTLQGRAAYLFENTTGGYAKPMLDVTVSRVDMDGFAEQGGGGLNLVSDGVSKTLFSLAPAVEFGIDLDSASSARVVRPWLTLGAAWRPDAELTVPVRFQGTPAGVQPFTVASPLDETVLTVQAGIDLFNPGLFDISAGYEGEFGDAFQRQSARVKIQVKF